MMRRTVAVAYWVMCPLGPVHPTNHVPCGFRPLCHRVCPVGRRHMTLPVMGLVSPQFIGGCWFVRRGMFLLVTGGFCGTRFGLSSRPLTRVEPMTWKRRAPLSALRVTVEEAFLHCGRA